MSEIPSSQVQEIIDYTTASDWERFIASIDELIIQWKLNDGGQSITSSPVERDQRVLSDRRHHETIIFRDCPYLVAHYCYSGVESIDDRTDDSFLPVMYDMKSSYDDFLPRGHCLTRWYGVKEFITITPAKADYAITSESKGNQLLSSVSVSLSNTKCVLPVFVQLQQLRRRLYVGQCLNRNFRINFEMVQLDSTPSEYKHLAGLTDVFKYKLSPFVPSSSLTISIRLTYLLNDFLYAPWVSQEIPDISNFATKGIDISDFQYLPFGAKEDPITNIYLATTWSNVAEATLIDNNLYSDLDPYHAHTWSLRAVMTNKPCQLDTFFGQFLDLCKNVETMEELIGFENFDVLESEGHASQALDKISKPAVLPMLDASVGRMVSKAADKVGRMRTGNTQIPSKVLSAILGCLFPDLAEVEGTLFNRDNSSDKHKSDNTAIDYSLYPIEMNNNNASTLYRGLKSASESSLTYMLAICLCIVNKNYGGIQAIAHLWRELVVELRYRWENNIIIPLLPLEVPNLQYCILHQKFQMLNCCIIQRRKRDTQSKSERTNKNSESPMTYGSFFKSMSTGYGSGNVNTIGEHDRKEKSEVNDPAHADDDNLKDNQETNVQFDSGNDSSEEEFFETLEDNEIEEELDTVIEDPKSKLREIDDMTAQPEGAKTRGGLLLLEANIHMNIPITQDPTPMTEDMLSEHAEILTRLGTSEEGIRIRARMQSASLLSDMEAFKAANPGCILEDFVRWYSPRDWISTETEDEGDRVETVNTDLNSAGNEEMDWHLITDNEAQDGESYNNSDSPIVSDQISINRKKNIDQDQADVEPQALANEYHHGIHYNPKWHTQGRLSARMCIPGNIWAEVWETAKPVPAYKQKRLFDYTKEAEKVFHYLSNLKPADVALQLLPVLIHAGIRTIESLDLSHLPNVRAMVEATIRRACRVSVMEHTEEVLPAYQELLKDIRNAECILSAHQSLTAKFICKEVEDYGLANLEAFTAKLLNQPEVVIEEAGHGMLGKIIDEAYISSRKILMEKGSEQGAGIQRVKRPRIGLSDPWAQEFVLRTYLRRPVSSSRSTPQRFYCASTGEEFRMAGAFCNDTIFQ